jgi:hypothetical protein
VAEDLISQPPAREDVRVHRARFAIAYLALAVAAGAGIGAAFLLLGDRGEQIGAPWSGWRPTGSESGYAKEIADYVAPRYRLPSGAQLVAVPLAGPPKVQNVAVRAVAIRPEAGSNEGIEILPTDDSLMYVLCGLGEQCAIAEGEPSEERHRLLRREALELALYTFKYVDDVDSVIALLPPNPEAEAGTAVFFQKNDFGAELQRPLSRTLALPDPPVGTQLDPREGLIVDQLTRPRLFSYQFQQAQEGSAIIILAPAVVGGI